MKNILVFIVFWLCAFSIYHATAGAGLVTDTTDWIRIYQTSGWTGIYHIFGDKSLHYVYQGVFFLTWKMFGLHGTLWMLLFVTFHALIAFFSFFIFNKLFSTAGVHNAGVIAFTGALLFVFSAYATEPVVWYACIHYHLCSLLLLGAFCALLFYLENGHTKNIVVFYVCFFVSVFTLEISFIFPFLLLVFFLFWPENIFKNVGRKQLIKIFVAPSVILIAVYLALSRLIRGHIVGHYGAAHLNFSIPLLMANLSKYIFKLFFQFQFVPYQYRSVCFQFFEKPVYGWLLFLVLLVVTVLFIFFRKRLSPRVTIAGFLFAAFIVGLLPILNLFIATLTNIENDRFLYFASIFGYQLLAFAVLAFAGRAGWLLVGVFFLFSLQNLFYNITSWRNQKQLNASLISNFKWYTAPEVYLLNSPDNFRGAYFYRAFPPDNSFYTELCIPGNTELKTHITDVMQYNMNAVSDSATVEIISQTELKVTLGQWGNWWWRLGIGGSNYDTPGYSVKVDEWGHSYVVRFNKKVAGAVYLYQCGREWRKVENF